MSTSSHITLIRGRDCHSVIVTSPHSCAINLFLSQRTGTLCVRLTATWHHLEETGFLFRFIYLSFYMRECFAGTSHACLVTVKVREEHLTGYGGL